MKVPIIAKAIGEPFPTPRRPAPCAYPNCVRDMPHDDSELAVIGELNHPTFGYIKKAMHLSHTDLAGRYSHPPEYLYEEINDVVQDSDQQQPTPDVSSPTPFIVDEYHVGITDVIALAKRAARENIRLDIVGERGTDARDRFTVRILPRND